MVKCVIHNLLQLIKIYQNHWNVYWNGCTVIYEIFFLVTIKLLLLLFNYLLPWICTVKHYQEFEYWEKNAEAYRQRQKLEWKFLPPLPQAGGWECHPLMLFPLTVALAQAQLTLHPIPLVFSKRVIRETHLIAERMKYTKPPLKELLSQYKGLSHA